MSEELETHLEEMIEWVKSMAETETPLFLAEFLRISMVEASLGQVCSSYVCLGGFMRRSLWGRAVNYFVPPAIGFAFIGLLLTAWNTADLLRILVAPRVWVLEYLRRFLP